MSNIEFANVLKSYINQVTKKQNKYMPKSNSQGLGPVHISSLSRKMCVVCQPAILYLILIDKNIESLTEFWLIYRADTITAINVLKRA
jgi:hypothetical protein